MGFQRFSGGFVGVDLFFVLSGYLLAPILWTSLSTLPARRAVADFWRHRVRRIVPAQAALLSSILAAAVIFPGLMARANTPFVLPHLLYLSDYWTLPNSHPEFSVLTHLWSLTVEMEFYAALTTLLVVMARRDWSRVRVVVSCVALALTVAVWRAASHASGRDAGDVYSSVDTRADSLLLGSALGLGLPLLGERLLSVRWQLWFGRAGWVGLIGLAVVATHVSLYDLWVYSPGFLGFAVLATLLVLGGVAAPRDALLRRGLRWKPLVVAGKYSYGFYLWHYATMTTGRLLGLSLTEWRVLGLISAVILTALSWRFVESGRLWDAQTRRRASSLPRTPAGDDRTSIVTSS